MEIEKSQYPQSSKIKNITQFHNIEYMTRMNHQNVDSVVTTRLDLGKYSSYQNVLTLVATM